MKSKHLLAVTLLLPFVTMSSVANADQAYSHRQKPARLAEQWVPYAQAYYAPPVADQYAYGINRASWSLQALSEAYEKTYRESASPSSISEYFIAAGYRFKKAKKSLMSCDPTYRKKLGKITSTLSHLSSDEKFFSIDEFGPFSIRIHGGTALVPGDQIRTIPQRQRSRGSLICTAALELSSNQILHFYSKKIPRR